MLYRDIQEEGWIRFDDDFLDKTIDKKELCKLIYTSYKNIVKYSRECVNLKLKERFDNLEHELRCIEKITGIYYINNAIVDKRSLCNEYNNFIVVEVNEKPDIILNLTTGEDMSACDNNCLRLIEGVTDLKTIYKDNNEYQMDMDICFIKSVILYKNVELYNAFNDTLVTFSDILKFIDMNGTSFYVDIIHNNIYKRVNAYYLKKKRKTNEKFLFNIYVSNINKVF